MNICMLSPTGLSLASAQHLLSEGRHLAARGLRVTLIVPHHYYLPFEEVACVDEARDGVAIKHVCLPRRWRGAVRTHLFPLGYWTWAIARRAVETPFDMLHVMKPYYTSGSAGLLLRLLAKKPMVLECDDLEGESGWAETLREEPLFGFKRRLISSLERRLPPLADAVIADTRALEDMLLSRGIARTRLCYIPYCVQDYMLREGNGGAVRRSRGLGNAPLVVYCGALHPHNYDCDMLLPAIARVREDIPEARMLIVGDGGARPGMEDEAARRGLSGSAVTFTGWVPQDEIPDYIAAADACVVPMRDTPAARARGLSKVLEYLCQGKPVVMPGIGQAAELTDGGKAGILVNPGDPGALAEGVAALLADPAQAREKGSHGRIHAMKKFDCSSATDRLLEVYRLAAGKGAAR